MRARAHSSLPLLAVYGVAPGASTLDAACGIGTQTIGLEQRGFRVRASDISPAAVARAQRELLERGLTADVHVGDLRALEQVHPGGFAAVLACDNAIPHGLADSRMLYKDANQREPGKRAVTYGGQRGRTKRCT